MPADIEYVLEYQTPKRDRDPANAAEMPGVWYQSKRLQCSEGDAVAEWKTKTALAEGTQSGIVYRLVKVTREVITG